MCTRIFVPLIEFGDSVTEISQFMMEKTALIDNICAKLCEYLPFKKRTSLQTYYVTLSRALLRLAVKLPDGSAVEENQKFVAGKA